MTVSELLGKSIPWLKEKGSDSAKVDAESLLARTLGLKRLELILQFERPVTTAEQDAFRALMKRRAAGEPVAYLIGRRGFWKDDFEVTRAVLIPRPETELLVELGSARAGMIHGRHPRVLDVGTGSGCVAISIARELPEAEIVAVDRSAEALAVARSNAEKITPGRVTFREGDGFAPVSGESFDVILSNPPYIPSAEIATLMPDVRDFEPRAALDGGADGLALIRPWAKSAFERLFAGGWCFFEVGAGQAESVLGVFREAGFADVLAKEDLGKIARVVGGRRP